MKLHVRYCFIVGFILLALFFIIYLNVSSTLLTVYTNDFRLSLPASNHPPNPIVHNQTEIPLIISLPETPVTITPSPIPLLGTDVVDPPKVLIPNVHPTNNTNHQKPSQQWLENLFQALVHEKLLTQNLRSKEHLWRQLKVLENAAEKQKHALIYLGWVAFWVRTSYMSG
jgi:hypothetical protein